MHSLTKDELVTLLAAAKKHSQRDYVMVLVGFYHGMRASEVCGLTAEHIRDGYIRVERLKGSETNVQEAHLMSLRTRREKSDSCSGSSAGNSSTSFASTA
jgi:integrase